MYLLYKSTCVCVCVRHACVCFSEQIVLTLVIDPKREQLDVFPGYPSVKLCPQPEQTATETATETE